MGINYVIVNRTKKQYLDSLPKQGEIAGDYDLMYKFCSLIAEWDKDISWKGDSIEIINFDYFEEWNIYTKIEVPIID